MQELQLNDADRYLLISAKPAPNGGLHIGHLAGPYLRQDMLRRHYLSRGATVTVVGGTDPIDSFISLRADQDGAEPDGVAQRYFERIRADFDAYDIHFDAFIDPLSPQWRARYIGVFAEVLARGLAEGHITEEYQPFPFSLADGRGASGAWLCGTCPDCRAEVSGYFCEDCGAHFEPSEVLDPHPRDPAHPLGFQPEADLFFNIREPDKHVAALSDLGVPTPLLDIVARHFEAGRTRIRLSELARWGVPIEPGGRTSYFGHGLLYGYCRLLGALYQELTGDPVNPFDEGSQVHSVNLFGVDNTVSHMVNIQAIGTQVDAWKGFDGFTVNRFLLLEGRKISTSARHGIWASDLIEVAGLHSDAVRFVLAATGPTDAERDLHIHEFLSWHNDIFIDVVCRSVSDTVDALPTTTQYAIPTELFTWFTPTFTEACAGHQFPVYDPAQQVSLLLGWLERRPEPGAPDNTYGWLKASALLLYPIAPRLASWAWNSLGEAGFPTLAALTAPSTPVAVGAPPLPEPIDADTLFRAMPATAVANCANTA